MPEFSDARCVAVACPACMTLELAQSCEGYVTSVVNGADLVPTMSLGESCGPVCTWNSRHWYFSDLKL